MKEIHKTKLLAGGWSMLSKKSGDQGSQEERMLDRT